MRARVLFLVASATSVGIASEILARQSTTSCPGYTASNIVTTSGSLTADLNLAGNACNTYGQDIDNLKLRVEYETGKKIETNQCEAMLT